MERGRRIALGAGIGAGVVLVLLAGAVLVLTRTDWGREQVRRIAVEQLRGAVDGEVRLGALEGDPLRRFRLVDVAIEDRQGRPFVRADTIALRLSLRSLLSRRIGLRDVRIVRAVVVLDRPPGEDWNFMRIFAPDPAPAEEPQEPGWGDWVELRDITLVDSRLTVRAAWQPAEDLTPAERQEALRRALSPDTRENVVPVPGGYQNVMDFRRLDAELPRILVANPDTAAIPIEVASLSGILLPYRPPAAVVRDLAGSFRLARDSLFMRDIRAVLPDSRIAGGGVYDLDSGDLLLSLRGEPVAMADLRWLYPRLPEEGGGSLTLDLRMRSLATRILARDADLRSGDSRLAGRMDLTVGDTLRLQDTRLRFSDLETDLLEGIVPALEFPRRGRFTGNLALAGTPRAMRVDGDVVFADAVAGVSRVIAEGQLAFRDETRFTDLSVRFDPLHLDVLRGELPELPAGASVTGQMRFDGAPQRLLRVDGQLALRDPASGTSRVAVRGGIGVAEEPRFRDLELAFAPLQMELLGTLVDGLPWGGTLEGSTTLNGSPGARVSFDADVVHREAGAVSDLAGTGVVALGREPWVDARFQLQPLSLATVGRLAPAAALKGSVRGELSVRGGREELALRTDLALPEGGTMRAAGTLDLTGRAVGYDLDANLDDVDLAAVTARSPVATSLTGEVGARGSGFDPATMQASLTADLTGSRIDDLPANDVRLRASVAGGLASVDSSLVRLGTTEALLDGSFGLVAGRHGVLVYDVSVDSLHLLAPWLPAADTGVAELRPRPRGEAIEEAMAERARALRSARVERIATGRPGPAPQPVDTAALAGIPRDSIAGSVKARGSLAGNVERFDLDGHAELDEVLYGGNYVESGRLAYSWRGIGEPTSAVAVDGSFRSVLVDGLAYDSVLVEGHYAGRRFGTGEAALSAFQDEHTDVHLDAGFTLAEARNELRLEELTLRFDTVTWRTAQPAVVSWQGRGVEVRALELHSDAGGRLHVDGDLPVDGPAELDVVVADLEIAHVMRLLQEDADAGGRLTLDARLEGTPRTPRLDGRAELAGGFLDGREIPDVRATFAYADRRLTAEAELRENGTALAAVDARLPFDLSLAGVEGPRLLEGSIEVDVRADSLPLDALAALSDDVRDLRGRVVGDVTIRGTFENPVLEGAVDLDRGSMVVIPLGVRFDRIAGSLRLQDDVVRVDSLIAWSRGPVRVTGEINVERLDEPAFDLAVVARDALVMDADDARLQVDADLTVSGPFDGVEVAGEVRTRSGVIYIPTLDDLGDRTVVSLDDPGTFERVDTILALRREVLLERSPLIENLEVALRVQVDRDVWLRSTEANVEIYTPAEVGPLSVRYEPRGRLDLEGTINTDRGEYEFMSRRFVLTRGAINFVGGSWLDAIVQLAAEHEVQVPGREAFSIRVVLGGQVLDPTITLESSAQPPISQTDLMSYLTFGREASTLLQAQGSALSGAGTVSGELVGSVAAMATQQMAAVALETVVNDLERDAARGLGLDVMRITPADLPDELFTGQYLDVLRGTEIEVGSYAMPRLFIGGQARLSLARPGVRAEYLTPRGFRWVTSWRPRYLPSEPTLAQREPERASIFGMFLFRDWRF